MGIIEPDLTITKDMDLEWQKLIMLVNQLFTAILCVNNIKCIPNTRTASPSTLNLLFLFPRNILYASSFLGCKQANSIEELNEYYDKIMTILPSKLILYGKRDENIYKGLNQLGFDHKQYKNFHSLKGI